jgi:hypothetical protein
MHYERYGLPELSLIICDYLCETTNLLQCRSLSRVHEFSPVRKSEILFESLHAVVGLGWLSRGERSVLLRKIGKEAKLG